jgi:hypothetical protein
MFAKAKKGPPLRAESKQAMAKQAQEAFFACFDQSKRKRKRSFFDM